MIGFILWFPFALNAEEAEDDTLPLMEGEGLTVTGSAETTQQMKVVTKEEIERRNASDLATLLQETLNLGVTRYGGYGNRVGINLRGFDSARIAFLIDGVPVNSPMGNDFDVSQLDLNAVERIEVTPGGSDTKYNVSGALGGVVNIITIKKQKTGLRLGGSVSNTSAMPGKYEKDGSTRSSRWEDLLDAQNYSFFTGFGAEKYSWSAGIFANRAANHFLYTNYEGKISRKENNEVWDTGVSGSYIRNLPDDYSKLIISGDVYYGDKNFPTSGLHTSLFGTQTDFSTRQNIMLDMPRAGRDDLAAEASLSHTWQSLEYEPPAGNSSLHNQHLITAINRWTWYPLARLTLRSGWDYRFNYLDSTDIGDRSRHDGGLYLTAEYKAHKTFLIIPSVKAAFSGPSEQPVTPVPKLGFLWTPLELLTIKNNYYRSFKYPDFEDLYWAGDGQTQGNPDLKPEDGWGGGLGRLPAL